MSEDAGELVHGEAVVGIRFCTECGDMGNPNEEFGVRGVARIGGNLCVECWRETIADTEREEGE